jgi:hypothetical protein
MRRLKPAQLRWTTEDRATFGQWFRVVCIGYGSLGLLLLAGLGNYAAHNGRTSVMIATAATTTQSPPSAGQP